MTDHQDQQLKAVTTSLINAGVGTAFHKRHLGDVAPALVEPAKGPLLTTAREGRGITLVGRDRAYDGAVLLARAMHLQGVGSLVVPLRRLVKWLEHDTEDATRAANVSALFVTNFFDHAVDCPLTGWQLQDVETLFNDRIDNSLANFPQVTCILGRGGWWSDTLVRRLARLNSVQELTDP